MRPAASGSVITANRGTMPLKGSLLTLGRLEIAVLDRLWERGPSDVVTLHAAVGLPRGLSRNTIQSTLERLVRKKLATRRKLGRAYEYRASSSRADCLRVALGHLTERLPGLDASLLLSTFVDFAERTGTETLDELEALIRERRREAGRARSLKAGGRDREGEES